MRESKCGQRALVGGALVCLSLLPLIPALSPQDSDIVERFRRITGNTEWIPVGAIPIRFDTFHPQGMAFVGEFFFFTSVEVTHQTEMLERPVGGYDRTAGEGVGHLFKLDRDGNLIASVTLGEGEVYHPGGIDFDGRFIWIPVAEYRPNSRSIVYRVDPFSMETTEVFRFDDHLGGLVFDTADATLHGVSWGSRFFYSWELNENLELTESQFDPAERRVPNGSYYVDYQDCQYVPVHYMLCGGVKTHSIKAIGDSPSLGFTIGGLDLIDLRSRRAIHQVPINWRVEDGPVMSANPFFVEPKDDHLRFFFMPEDNESTIYIFETNRE
ncbi:DUF6454 family protein [Gemmatimonadota bacterium]